jgi:23S rRNA (cytosine1962-C5)-methyltransferase
MENSMENGEVLIRKRGGERIRRGHVWVYRSDVLRADGVEPGSIVSVREETSKPGSILGKAFFSSESQITLRLLVRGDVAISEEFFRRRLADAADLRERLGVDPLFSRRVYAEGDFLPGLIVDRYNDCLVVQSLIQATDRFKPLFTKALQDQYGPRSILLRNDSRVRQLEGLDLAQEVIGDPITDTITLIEDEKQVVVTLSTGQKTGAFLDQRDNRQAARRYAHGRALDAFAYAGGFALQLSDVCEDVEAVDISASAVQLAQANVDRNNLKNVRCIEANVFDYLRDRHTEGIRYDTIVLDPPAFAKSRAQLPAALRGYKEINNRAMRLLKDGGTLITCSCSHHLSESLFSEMLAEAANDAGVYLRILERRIQSRDHPIILTVPETLYLKCFIAEVRH